MTQVAENLARVRERIAGACARVGRDPNEVELIAVSKLQPAQRIVEAYDAGQRAFGENYAQELRDKASGLSGLKGLRWHAIGPLQSNKAKYVAKSAHVFHALERLEVAEELSRRRDGGPLRCFLQIHLGPEDTKGGVSPTKAAALLEQARLLPKLEVVGLMALPPLERTAESARPYFRQLRSLAEALKLTELSMGTTFDFEVAIEEGATCVRVGTAIFGERP